MSISLVSTLLSEYIYLVISMATGAVGVTQFSNEQAIAKNPNPTQSTNTQENEPTDDTKTKVKKGFQFWAILFAISIAALLCAIEGTITSTALPTIVAALNGADKYVWSVNIYYLFM